MLVIYPGGAVVLSSKSAEKYQPVELWNKTTGGNFTAFGYGVTVDSEDNIIVVSTKSEGWLSKVWVIKYDSYGDMLWNKTTEGRVSSDSGYGIAIDSEDNIIITGETHSFGDSDVLVIKYDSYGNVIWNKTSGGKPESYGKESACVSGTNTVIIMFMAGIMRESDKILKKSFNFIGAGY